MGLPDTKADGLISALPECGLRIMGLSVEDSDSMIQAVARLGGKGAAVPSVALSSSASWDAVCVAPFEQMLVFAQSLVSELPSLAEFGSRLARSLRFWKDPNPDILDCRGRFLRLSEKTHVMGILNATPDSFFDGGRFYDTEKAVDHVLEMVDQGADIIDIGGESTRPGSDPVDEVEEIQRVVPIFEKLKGRVSVPLSIDTRRANVAKAALEAGASLVNDISGLTFDKRMAEVVSEAGVPLCVMHMRGVPENMQTKTEYRDLIGEMIVELTRSLELAKKTGIPDSRILVDPGIGFAKTAQDNLVILERLDEFQSFGQPLLVGVSRKSFIGRLLGNDDPEQRLMGTAAAVACCALRGAAVVRVHDVKESVQVIRIADALSRSVAG
jgi:dihydropteroate synthase